MVDAQAAIDAAVAAAGSTGFKAWIIVDGERLSVTQSERHARASRIIEIIHPADCRENGRKQ